jgi:NAD(P)-dependent dehydrogenase (short-subunit alcohol dehydrogenase family)
MAKLDGRVVLITGASRGIGRAIAIALADHGASFVLAARDMQKLDETMAMLGACGVADDRIAPMRVDLTDEASIVRMIDATARRFGRLDVLINNAGITHSAKLEHTTTADLDRVWATNVRGPYIVCRQAIPLMRDSGGGAIVNISSVVGIKGYALQTAYTASKHAIRGMSIALAEELRNDRIRVHVICPGGVATEMVTQVRPDIPTDELIQPEEIAELVAYLVTHTGNAVVDEIRMRRASSPPWF